MLAMIQRVAKQRDVDFVIVHQLSRFARNRLDDALVTAKIEEAGAVLVSCLEGIDQTASGRMMQGVLAVVNEYQSRNQSDDIKRKTLQKVKDGGTPTLAPIGYLNVQGVDGNQDKRSVIVDHDRAPHITWAFEEYATGKWSLNSLLEELTARGLRTRATATRSEKPLHLSMLQRILIKPYYTGIVTFHGVKYQGKHEPLVSFEVFEKVQEVLTLHNLAGERHWRHKHYLKGTIFCAKCGGRLSLTHATGRHGGHYVYFFCLGRRRDKDSCWQKALQVDVVESLVERFWQSVRMSAERADELRSVLRDGLADARAEAEKDRAIQERRTQQLTEERKKLLDAYYGGAIPMELMRSEQDRITQELKIVKERLTRASRMSDQVEVTLEKAIRWARDLPRAYQAADDHGRRQLNQAVFKCLWVFEDGIAAYEFTEGVEILFERRPTITPVPPRAGCVGHDQERFAYPTKPNPGHLHARGLNVAHVVEVAGIERATPPRSIRRSATLNYR
jgi:DNA invertase Pin-like site-specific DNA recombinase